MLFLIPVPWTGPVWAPLTVSAALIGFGLAAAREIDAGRAVRVGRTNIVLGLCGGLLVILSFTLDAARIMSGGLPGWYPWPVFVAGMVVAGWGALIALGPENRRNLAAAE